MKMFVGKKVNQLYLLVLTWLFEKPSWDCLDWSLTMKFLACVPVNSPYCLSSAPPSDDSVLNSKVF